MSYQLVIAEKPSVARSIAGVIGADKKQDGYMEGNGYLVSWCIGHLVSLADAGTYDERFKKWRYDDLPILPQQWQYIIPNDKKKQFDTAFFDEAPRCHRPCVRHRRRARGGIDFPFCLPDGGLQETVSAPLDFQHGGRGHQGRLCPPETGN